MQDLTTTNSAPVFVHGHPMVLHEAKIDRYISPALRASGIFEPFETELAKVLIKPGDVVLDLGANIGYYTLLFARLVGPAGRVYAFEPEPANCALLKKNVELNGYENVVLVSKAVSNQTGLGKLFLCDFNQGDHRLYDSKDGRPHIEIETVELDRFFHNYGGSFDFIKFDIQGAEWA